MNQITHIFLEGGSLTLKKQTKIFRLKAQKKKKKKKKKKNWPGVPSCSFAFLKL